MNRSITLLASSVLIAFSARADVVVPVDSVENHVNVRMEADSGSEIVGRLRQGESLRYERTVDGWHEVLLVDDAYGYVHGDWGVVITDEAFAARQADGDVTEADAPAMVQGEATAPQPEETEVATVATVADAAQPADTDTTAAAEPAEQTVNAAEEVPAKAATEAAVAVEAASDVAEQPALEVSLAADATDMPDAQAVEPVENEPKSATEPAAASSHEAVPVPALVTTVAGPAGPPGPPGPAGPASKVNIEGTADHLIKFTKSTIGGNSQVFDDGNNVGIGTTEPKQRLEVNGNIQIHERNSNVAALMLTQSSGDTGYIMHNRANTLTIGAGSVDRLTIDRDGNIGMGIAKPSHPIEMASGAYVSAGGVWTNSSSRSRKQDIVELQPAEATAALQELQPVRFRYRTDESEEYVGFIAEDVPDLVASSDRESLSAMDIVAVLTKVVQQQQQQIDDLENRLQELAR